MAKLSQAIALDVVPFGLRSRIHYSTAGQLTELSNVVVLVEGRASCNCDLGQRSGKVATVPVFSNARAGRPILVGRENYALDVLGPTEQLRTQRI